MDRFPRISLITPSLNQGQYLEQTIRSVLDQEYPNLEYVVIDGGSTDGSVDIIRRYAKHLSYWVSQPDGGQSDAINHGLSRATGEVFNWLNSDDYCVPRSLWRVADAFTNPAVTVLCGRSHVVNEAGQMLFTSRGTDVYADNLARTIGWARIDQPETFFRMNVLRQIGPLDARLHYLMDRDWWIKYLFAFGLAGVTQIPDALVNFRRHGASKSVAQAAGFQTEHDTLFTALATQYSFGEVAAFIVANCTVMPSFEARWPTNWAPALVGQVLQYYLLLRANEHYAQRDRPRTKQWLAAVDARQLAVPDRRHCQQLRLRNQWLPPGLVRWLRKK